MNTADPGRAQGESQRPRLGLGAIPLVQVARGPDIVIAAHEVQARTRLAHAVEPPQEGFVAAQQEVGVVEPEVEDVAEQDQVLRLAGIRQELQKAGLTGLLGAIRPHMEVGVADEEGGHALVVAVCAHERTFLSDRAGRGKRFPGFPGEDGGHVAPR